MLLQHEFGIFPGSDGDRVLDLVARLQVPVVTVLHTVLIDPSARQRRIVEELAQHSAAVVVLTPSAADRLVTRYAVDRSIVSVIPHGAEPNLDPCPREPGALPTLLTWGLLGPGKGIEHAIKAVVILAGRGIIVRYVVAGQTHPNVVAYEGERYREALVQLADELGAGSLVTFDDRYRDWAGLFALIRTADIVVLPYDSREQVTSGVLVDAAGLRQAGRGDCVPARPRPRRRPLRRGGTARGTRSDGRRHPAAAHRPVDSQRAASPPPGSRRRGTPGPSSDGSTTSCSARSRTTMPAVGA